MSTEELKMIVDMIAGLGENGKVAFIWYLAANYGLSFLKFAVGAAVVTTVIHSVARKIHDLCVRDMEKNKETRRAIAIGAMRAVWLYDKGLPDEFASRLFGIMKELEAIEKANEKVTK